jgi:hypothetical protein
VASADRYSIIAKYTVSPWVILIRDGKESWLSVLYPIMRISQDTCGGDVFGVMVKPQIRPLCAKRV